MNMQDANRIYSKLLARGFNDIEAKALVINMQDESGLNPGINEHAPIVPGSRGGFGYIQLTGPRRVAYEAYADSIGVPYHDEDAQLDWIAYERQGPEKAAWDKISQASSVGEAATGVVRHFLRPLKEHQDSRSAKYSRITDLDFTPDGGIIAIGPDPSRLTPDQVDLNSSVPQVQEGVPPVEDPTLLDKIMTEDVKLTNNDTIDGLLTDGRDTLVGMGKNYILSALLGSGGSDMPPPPPPPVMAAPVMSGQQQPVMFKIKRKRDNQNG